MQVRVSGLLRVIASFFSGIGGTFEAFGQLFETIGDPCVSFEVLAILIVIWWRGSYSYLILAFTIIAVITLETGDHSIIRVPTLTEVLGWLVSR